MSSSRDTEFQDSGVEWLGSVPKHWKIHRFKQSTKSCRNGIWGAEACGNQNDIKCVRVADFDREHLVVNAEIPTLRNVGKAEKEQRVLKKGDLLLEKSGGGELQPVGAVVLYDSDEPAICSNFIAKVELSDGMDPSYWRYCHAAAYSVRLNSRSIKQTSGIQNLDHSQYLNEYAPYPPLPEQRSIAAFLDAETSKIDALVAEQRRLIELLKEKRQAVISHAVTKGLNPHVKMKPSGIDWLGDIPEHWEMKALKHLGTICYGIGEPPTYYDSGVPLIRATNVRSGALTPVGLVFVKPEQIPSQRIVWLRSGDIIVVRSGAGTGDSAIIPENYGPAIAGFDMVFQVRFASPWYVQYSLLSDFVTKAQLDIVKTRAAQPHLNAQELGSCLIALPPRTEQEGIVQYLSERVHEFNELEKSAEKAVALLQERRTALISAAVTGKIDVRGFVLKEASA